jgi:hypothetical protein
MVLLVYSYKVKFRWMRKLMYDVEDIVFQEIVDF